MNLAKVFQPIYPLESLRKVRPPQALGGQGGAAPFSLNFHVCVTKKADLLRLLFLLWCFLLLLLLHKRALGKKQLMVNLVFQRGQDVTRLQTAIFCVVPVLVQKVEYLFSSRWQRKKTFFSSFFCCPSERKQGRREQKNGFQFSFG